MESKCLDSDVNTNPTQPNFADLMNQLPNCLSHIYWIENTLLKILPDWNKAIHSNTLDKAFSEYHLTVAEQVYQLEHVFELLKLKAQGKIFKEMSTFLKSEISLPSTAPLEFNSDLDFLSRINDIVSFKMKFYKTLVDIAKALRLNSTRELLQQNLETESHAGHRFLNFK